MAAPLNCVWLLLASLLLLVVVLETKSAPILLGNQMSSLSVIPRTEEQAVALLEFLQNNPQYGSSHSADRSIQVNTQEFILVPKEDVARLSTGLQEIGLRLETSSSTTYQTF